MDIRKIIFVIFITLSIFTLGKDFNKYESKRLFDMGMDADLNGNHEKYQNDPKMYKILDMGMVDYEEMLQLVKILKLAEDFQYKVLDVTENGNKSTLKLWVRYRVMTDTKDNLLKLITCEEFKDMNEDVRLFAAYVDIRKKAKSKFVEKEITVYMEKENGLWDAPNAMNDELGDSVFSGFTSFLELLAN